MSTPNEIRALALDMPESERAKLARDLITSLHEPLEDPDEVQAAWLGEVEARLREVDDGTAELLEWDEVRRRVLERLGRT